MTRLGMLLANINIGKLNDIELNKLINIFDKDGIIMLFELKRSDLLAQNQSFHYLLDDYEKQKIKVLNMN
jgi:hypothetical protein